VDTKVDTSDLAGISDLTKPDIGQPISLLTIIKVGRRMGIRRAVI
jgi:hypothetical protein